MSDLPELPPPDVSPYDSDDINGPTEYAWYEPAVHAFARQVVAEAMERAAQIAEKEQVEEIGPGDAEYNLACTHIAAAIRKETL